MGRNVPFVNDATVVRYMLDDGAFMPTKGHSSDAGFDLYTPHDFIIEPNEGIVIDTGVHLFIQKGYVGLVLNKSGLSCNCSIETATGVVDADYTGSIRAKVWNHGRTSKAFNKGEEITQIVVLPIPEVTLMPAFEKPETERGENGFGSTGR